MKTKWFLKMPIEKQKYDETDILERLAHEDDPIDYYDLYTKMVADHIRKQIDNQIIELIQSYAKGI